MVLVNLSLKIYSHGRLKLWKTREFEDHTVPKNPIKNYVKNMYQKIQNRQLSLNSFSNSYCVSDKLPGSLQSISLIPECLGRDFYDELLNLPLPPGPDLASSLPCAKPGDRLPAQRWAPDGWELQGDDSWFYCTHCTTNRHTVAYPLFTL